MPTKHELNDAEKALIAEIQQEMHNLTQQLNGALRLALKIRGLEPVGWTLRGNEFVYLT